MSDNQSDNSDAWAKPAMSDITDRLRSLYMDTKNMLPCALEHEAADEIDKLRETQAKFGQVQHDLLSQIDALREQLAQPAPVPVAWLEQRTLSTGGYDQSPIVEWQVTQNPATSNAPRKPLYLHPAAPVPMIGASTHQQVFDALENAHWLSGPPHERIKQLIAARESAAPVPRKMDIPPAPVDMMDVVYAEGWNDACDAFFGGLPPAPAVVITVSESAAPVPAPLTDEKIDAIANQPHGGVDPAAWFRNAARAIERAHGIGIAASPEKKP